MLYYTYAHFLLFPKMLTKTVLHILIKSKLIQHINLHIQILVKNFECLWTDTKAQTYDFLKLHSTSPLKPAKQFFVNTARPKKNCGIGRHHLSNLMCICYKAKSFTGSFMFILAYLVKTIVQWTGDTVIV